jgi:hypothetical protein
MIRTANIEVSLQRLNILRIEHPQANPLRLACTLRAGETFPSGLTVTAEIHTSRNVPAETAPLAASTVTVPADATSFEVLFDSPQTNQPVAPDSVRACWMVLYGVDDADQVHVLSAADLLLGWHAVSRLTADPPATSILIEKGGVAWASGRSYVTGTVVTVGTTAYICTADNLSTVDDEPGVGMEWESFWVVLSGGGGGTVTLTGAVTGSGTGTVTTTIANNAVTTAKIADGAVTVSKTTGFGTIATQNANSVTITGGSITGITDLAIADGGTGSSTASGALANLGAYPATNPSGYTTNTGTVTSVSVTTANGVSATVTNGTTTPALSFTLGAITPTSVNGIAFTNGGSGALTVTGTAAVSGTNTGNQTITLTGDVTGSGTGSFAATIAANAVTYAKMQAVSAASRLLGRGTVGTTAVREITLGTGLVMTSDALSVSTAGSNTIIQFFPKDNEPPVSGFAAIDTRNSHPVLDFPASGSPTAIFRQYIPAGVIFAESGTALTVYIDAAATSATSGVIGWNVSLERLTPGGQDLDSDNFGTAQTGSNTINATSGVMTRVAVTFTQAQLPASFAAGDMFRLRVVRNTSVGSNHTGDAELVGVFADFTPGGGA